MTTKPAARHSEEAPRPLSKPAFVRLVVAQALTLVCDGVALIALPLLLLRHDNAASLISVSLAMVAVGGIVGLFGSSAIVDRVSKRTALQFLEGVRLVAIAVLVASVSGGAPNPAVVAIAALALGCASSCYRPILSAYIGIVVSDDMRKAANAVRSTVSKTAAIISPAFGAIFTTLSPTFGLIVVAGGSCTISVILLSTISRDRPVASTDESFLDASVGGFRYCWSNLVLRRVIMQGALQIGLTIPPVAAVLALHLADLDRDYAYGWYFTAEAVGAIVGAAIAAKYAIPASRRSLMITAFGGCLIPLALAVNSVTAGVTLYALGGLGLGCFGVIWISYLQETVDRGVLGRVLNVDAIGPALISPIAILVVGWLSTSVPAATIGLVLAAAGCASLLILIGAYTNMTSIEGSEQADL